MKIKKYLSCIVLSACLFPCQSFSALVNSGSVYLNAEPWRYVGSGNDLQVGFYDKSTRFPFNFPTRPGLSFSGKGRGNNMLGGWFNVLDVAYDLNGEVLRFAIDFR